MKLSMEYESSGARIKNCALDFLYLGYDITDDDDYNDDDDKQESSWVVMEGDVVLKSTFMYCDFCRMIKAAPPHERHHLTTLASTLLSSFEQLSDAVKRRSLSLTRERHKKACDILEEVVASMPPSTFSDEEDEVVSIPRNI